MALLVSQVSFSMLGRETLFADGFLAGCMCVLGNLSEGEWLLCSSYILQQYPDPKSRIYGSRIYDLDTYDRRFETVSFYYLRHFDISTPTESRERSSPGLAHGSVQAGDTEN